MALQMTMFSKAASSSFTSVRPSKAQRNTVAVRAGAYDEELVQTAVRALFLDGVQDRSVEKMILSIACQRERLVLIHSLFG